MALLNVINFRCILKVVSIWIWGCFVTLAFADVPVVDYSSDAADATESTSITLDQRVNKIEQQINNINSQNVLRRIEELQQELQRLNGQIESQNHQIELLSAQLKKQHVEGVTLETTTGDVTPPSTPSMSTDNAILEEQQVYQSAIDLLPDEKQKSKNRLQLYLKQCDEKIYKGIYAGSAHFWIADIEFLQKNFPAAEKGYRILITEYPESKRVPDAKLKIALIHLNQSKIEQAKEELKKVIQFHSGTSAARLAEEQLRQLGGI
ncbi:MAG: tetratricopeptide repeat protein [Coxiellaceae bacterium]|nr:tetratricopeptide repeat protein [Coxiellaceae bacterium]